MLTAANLKALARARLADAEALCHSRRFDCAAYLCGYVVELALKARICRTLKWPIFPEKRSEFEDLQSFKTRDLVVLLRLSGREPYIRESLFPEWAILREWNPEARYRPIGSVTAPAVREMIAAARRVMMKL